MILDSTKRVVVDMENMVKWWTVVADALTKVEDATHRMKRGNELNSAIIVAITRITRALDSYCEAVSLKDQYSDAK